jgi:hypothetical protein
MTPPKMTDEEVVAALVERDGWTQAIAGLIQARAESQPVLAEPLLAALLFHCADIVTSTRISAQDAMDLFTTILVQVEADRVASPMNFVVMPSSSRSH